ncbi:MAG TPA: peptidoglycan DD-metalloendopeptidase family protein [Terriglobales bacterium]|nr:peptidoglycan DD-metalloendopeptidase family protein [Terriglobales bacterium]
MQQDERQRPRLWVSGGLVLAAASMLCCSCLPAWAQSSQDLDVLHQQIEQGQAQATALQKQADDLGRQINQLQDALVKSAQSVQDSEQQASDLESNLATLTEEEKHKTDELAVRRQQMTETLMALERLSVQPAQAALFADRSAIDQARTASLLSLIVPQLDKRADALKAQLADLHDLHAQIVDRREKLTTTLGTLADQNQKLADLIAQKSRLQKSTLAQGATTQDKLKLLADQAQSLKDLLDRIDRAKQEEAAKQAAAAQAAAAEEAKRQEATRKASRRPGSTEDDATGKSADLASANPSVTSADLGIDGPAGKAARPFPDKPGGSNGVRIPVRGTLVSAFGSAASDLSQARGILLETRPQAQVVAPFDGRIVFQGPFRSYGQILIIEHRGGYHTVLAGLGRVDAIVGQWLVAGEPVGIMGTSGGATADTGQSAAGSETSNQDHPKLYVELRHNGQPVDPAPWFGSLTRVDNSEGQ